MKLIADPSLRASQARSVANNLAKSSGNDFPVQTGKPPTKDGGE